MEYVMKYNFDEAVERRGTGCLKYDFAKERGKKEDVLPLWVAETARHLLAVMGCRYGF